MNNIIEFRRISAARSEMSVTSPEKQPASSEGWKNSDSYQLPLARIQQIKTAPAANKVEKPYIKEQAPEKKLGRGKRLIALAGVLSVSLGVLGGLVSIVALGPLGLAVAAGAGALGIALIKIGTR